MKIKVPKSIRIGAHNYSVAYRENMKLDDNWRGACNQRTAEILIDPIGGETINRSFLHEVTHMIDFNYEINLHEDDVSRLAHGIAELLESLGIELDWSDIK